jgi:5-methylcytosine-specific restriction endonuclease McrA
VDHARRLPSLSSDGVAWTLGRAFHILRGGIQRTTGLQSRIDVHPIIAVKGAVPSRAWRQTPALTNAKLFVRDRHVCAYCGRRSGFDLLTREHVIPVSRGGRDTWMNCITACRGCNGRKGNRLPGKCTCRCLPALRARACTRT